MINYRNGREFLECEVDECQALTSSIHGLCTKHYKAQWYLNSVGRTKKIERTSKGRWVHKVSGYIMIKVLGILQYEHRVLAEKALGRPLPSGVVIHHTGAPDDNHGFCKLVICP